MWLRLHVLLLFLLSAFALHSVHPSPPSTIAAAAAIPSCCPTATTDACRNYCQKMDLGVARRGGEKSSKVSLDELASHCPPSMEPLWRCLNVTRGERTSQVDYLGRQCCSLSPVHQCQVACLRAKHYSEDLASECRKSDNIQLFHCLNLIREGEECCNMASDVQCRRACSTVYSATATSVSGAGINGTLRSAANSACSRSPSVMQCARKLLKGDRVASSPSTLECCDKGATFQCRETCRAVLKAGESDALDMLVKDCGELLLTEPLWKCFMSKSPPASAAERMGTNNDRVANDIKNSGPIRINSATATAATTTAASTAVAVQHHHGNYDAAKLSCCDRGTLQCYRLCRMAHTNDFFPESEELDNCVAQPREATMTTCFEDVDEPCQPGCSNLSFCSSFNNRPLELFRNCNPEADAAALNVFQDWIKMTFVVLPGLDVKLWGPSTCMMHHWKALACALQFKPCRRNMPRTTICWNSCVKLIKGCMTQSNDTLAIELCQRLTPESFSGSCISLEDYLTPQPKTAAVVAPCRYNICRPDQVCVVDHQSPDSYSCLSGCKFGERSKMLGFPNSWVQLPTPSTTCPYHSCNEICYCNAKGEFQQCHAPPPQAFEACRVGGMRFEHGAKLQNDCNRCVCHYGELVCTRYRCDNSSGTSTVVWSCPLQPNPVCTSSGKRYLNTCVAQWQGSVIEPLESCPHEGPDSLFAPECYTVIHLVYSQKQIDRLSRSTNKSTIFSASQVEQSLRYLMSYSHCHVSVFHSIDGELLVVVHSQIHCASCSAEAEKLVMLFDNRSPQVTLNVQLDVILLAEVVQFVQLHPSDRDNTSSSAGQVVRGSVAQPVFVIPFILSVLRFI